MRFGALASLASLGRLIRAEFERRYETPRRGGRTTAVVLEKERSESPAPAAYLILNERRFGDSGEVRERLPGFNFGWGF